MTATSPLADIERQQKPTELTIVIGVKINQALAYARELEALEEMQGKPKVDVEEVINAFPEHLRNLIRRFVHVR